MSFWTDGSGYWRVRTHIIVWTTFAVVVIAGGWQGIDAWATKLEEVKTYRGRGDAPRPLLTEIDGRPADSVTEMPDGFPSVASKCVWDGYRAFVTSNGDAIHVVEDADCSFEGTGPDTKRSK